ncbi:Conjugal transfer, TrbD [methanotrophic bacterial endosymbiont of Bathymodiolus sp.]|nr:Conjugal transfer, TrbD [methanotrophic bacterial endosymbiont of Bathymodiolus sp.]
MEDGYTAPIHRGLITPILIVGLPRTLAFILWTTACAVGFGLQEIWVLPIFFIFHIGFAILTKKDPYFFDVFKFAMKAHRRLDP